MSCGKRRNLRKDRTPGIFNNIKLLSGSALRLYRSWSWSFYHKLTSTPLSHPFSFQTSTSHFLFTSPFPFLMFRVVFVLQNTGLDFSFFNIYLPLPLTTSISRVYYGCAPLFFSRGKCHYLHRRYQVSQRDLGVPNRK